MKKKILGFTLAAMALSIASVNAQNPGSTSEAACQEQVVNQKPECCKNKKDGKHKKDGVKADRIDHKGPRFNPFNGIDLTPEQQQQIDKLKAERKEQRKQNKDADKAAKKEAQAKEREAYEAELAKILTPAQFATYKSNTENLKARSDMKGKKIEKKKGEKRDKKKNAEKTA